MTSFKNAYISRRDDIVSLIPEGVERVLDVGCSVGVLGEQIKCLRGGTVVGIEMDPEMAKVAGKVLDRVYCMDIEKEDSISFLKEDKFDCIIFADVLEHTRDPWRILQGFTQLLDEDGYVLASIPNVRHISTIKELLVKSNWPYRERGIHDKSHLRFFTLKNIMELFEGSGLEIIAIHRKFRIFEKRTRKLIDRVFPRWMPILFKELFVFQYLVCARKR